MYNCKSDTESLNGQGNVVLSTTCFPAIPLTYGVLYGCTPRILNRVTKWLKYCAEACFHPMILPMVFVELERKRLLDAGEDRGTKLRQRILDMGVRSNKQPQGKVGIERGDLRPAASTGDSETIDMLLSMDGLKNGLDALLTQLSSMRGHIGKPSDITLANNFHEVPLGMADVDGVNIDLRLREMMTELESKLRTYQGLLETITLVTQMVWGSGYTYYPTLSVEADRAHRRQPTSQERILG